MIRSGAGRVEPCEVVAGHEYQRLEVLFAESGRVGQPSSQFLSEGLADDVIEKLVLVVEVGIERGPVYRCPLGDLLHGEPGMALFRH